MPSSRPTTVGALRDSGYAPRPVKSEIRANLLRKLRSGEDLFPGVLGYDDTVVPQIVNALLARHDFILLGLRGQAKSRILRAITGLLDEEIPVLAGSEVNDDPLQPLSKFGRELVEAEGDAAPVVWIPREQRYVEKLATPDVTIADIVGDIDPIKAARGGHILADELTIHFGLMPRANRGIFAINELPDLSGKIQVGLFNVLQEGDVQVKGYPVRLPLDLLLVFTANPEDYTARGKIITPLKDRIGSEIRTHYPRGVDVGIAVTRQEAWTERDGGAGGLKVEVPAVIAELVERIAFGARRESRIDQRSGVSQRLPISVLEVVVSSAERRALLLGEERAVPRISDVYAALPAITGKLELEYEGELHGHEKIGRELIASAALGVFDRWADDADVEEIVEYFERGAALQVGDDSSAEACLAGFATVPGLLGLVHEVGMASESGSAGEQATACELVLEALVAEQRVSRSTSGSYRRPLHDEGSFDPFGG